MLGVSSFPLWRVCSGLTLQFEYFVIEHWVGEGSLRKRWCLTISFSGLPQKYIHL